MNAKHTLLLTLLAPALAAPVIADSFVVRVGRAETVSKGVIEHAVIYVEDGKIALIGEDLPVDRGIRVIERPDWVAIPGLVNCYSRLGCDSEGGDENSPEAKAGDEVYPGSDDFKEIVKYGVTTLAVYPAGNGIPGQAVVLRPTGSTLQEMTLKDPAYVKIIVRAEPGSKKRLVEGFKKADDYDEKVKKAREKFDKDKEKKGKKEEKPAADEKKEEKKSALQEPKEEKKEEPAKGDGFVPPAPDPKVKPWVDLRKGHLRALVSITSAAEYAHFLDAIGKEKFSWDLRLVMNRDNDFFYVERKKDYDLDYDGIGDKKVRVVMEPILSLHPSTMRARNTAREMVDAGAKLVFIPRNDSLPDHKQWFAHVGELVAVGLPRDVALRAMTLEPAELLGVADRVGSLEKGKDANIVFVNGDPFEPTTRIQAVVLEGKIVHGEVSQ